MSLRVGNWQSVRTKVAAQDPHLARLLDALSLDDEYRFYTACYPYGLSILKNSVFYLPGEDYSVISVHDMPEPIRSDLNYNINANGAGIIIRNKMEQFVMVEDRIVPFSVYGLGSLLGLTTVLDDLTKQQRFNDYGLWEITSGARSVFMLPKISDMLSFNKLKKIYQLEAKKPEHYTEHWSVFSEIARKRNCDWTFEVVFFSRKLIEKLKDPACDELKSYFLEYNRQFFGFWRNLFSWQVTFSRIECLRNLKQSAHLLDTAKHLFAVAAGIFPAFQPATDNSFMPRTLIQEIYLNEYGLKDYIPVIMQPSLSRPGEILYSSLGMPISVEYSPKSALSSSNINDLSELMGLLKRYVKELLSRDLDIARTNLYRIVQNNKFDFYHVNSEDRKDIQTVEALIARDPRFIQDARHGNEAFPVHSRFFKGCIALFNEKSIDKTL
ncbi:MAG: hypothetical protein NTV32_02655 [Gammaproteobacteria bacterium]|nr:hypothetical protein [Gammaproteobacteria bacterium]